MISERGFTLLEILAALAIAVIGISAVVNTTASAVSILQSSENRVLSSWVASNRLAEMRLSRKWPAAVTSDKSVTQGGRVWHYREEVSKTDDPDLLRIDISVFDDTDHTVLSTKMFGYLSRYSAPTAPPSPPDGSGEQVETETTETGEAGAGEAPENETQSADKTVDQ